MPSFKAIYVSSGRAYSAGHLNSFWVGPNREDCRPNLVMREGQSFEALWAGTSFRPTKGSILKEARASLGQSRSESLVLRRTLAQRDAVCSGEKRETKGFPCGRVADGGKFQVLQS